MSTEIVASLGLGLVTLFGGVYLGVCIYDKYRQIRERQVYIQFLVRAGIEVTNVVTHILSNRFAPVPQPPNPMMDFMTFLTQIAELQAQNETDNQESHVQLADVLANTTVWRFAPVADAVGDKNDAEGANPPLIPICTICQDTVQDNDIMRTITACGHEFHLGCLDTALIRTPTCPLCRQTVLIESDSDDDDSLVDDQTQLYSDGAPAQSPTAPITRLVYNMTMPITTTQRASMMPDQPQATSNVNALD
jgi:hypothetical protein